MRQGRRNKRELFGGVNGSRRFLDRSLISNVAVAPLPVL